MIIFQKLLKQGVACALMMMLSVGTLLAQGGAGTGTLRGEVKDESGGVIVGAAVTVIDGSGAEKTGTTNDTGVYNFMGLAPGTYTVRACSGRFLLFREHDR
jgi:hypothetical protein